MNVSNTQTSALITWDISDDSDITYTVNIESQGSQVSNIRNNSFTLTDLEIETDYAVSVFAAKCGISSLPSDPLTVRIGVQGMYIYWQVAQFTCTCTCICIH